MKALKCLLGCSLAASFLFTAADAHAGVFSENPLPQSSGQVFTNAFMQLDSISPQGMHTGEDITASPGDVVFSPIASGNTCRVIAVGLDYVLLLSAERPGGDYALAQFIHINPNPNLVVGSWINKTVQVGTVQSGHLHFEIFLSSDMAIGDSDLKSPRKYALDNVSWNADSTSPVIDEVDAPDGSTPIYEEMVWKIKAHDESGSYYNGIGGIELLMDDDVVDRFDFDGKLSKQGTYPPSAGEFYACTTCIPTGYNNPNVLQYKLTWVREDGDAHIWRLRWWDSQGNSDEGDPTEGPATEVSHIAIDAFPNPTSELFNFQISMNRRDDLSIDIYDVHSRKVRTLYGGSVNPGMIPLVWDTRNDSGRLVAPGAYFIRLTGRHTIAGLTKTLIVSR